MHINTDEKIIGFALIICLFWYEGKGLIDDSGWKRIDMEFGNGVPNRIMSSTVKWPGLIISNLVDWGSERSHVRAD